MVDISGLDKESVLAALYNASAPRRLGFLKYDPRAMDIVMARHVIRERGHDAFIDLPVMRRIAAGPPYWGLDYVYGRPIKVNLAADRLEPRGYDFANEQDGLMELVLSVFRRTGDVNAPEIFGLHMANLEAAARQAYDEMDEGTRVAVVNGLPRRVIGLSNGDADALRAVLERILLAPRN
jgi:hypothetical protein